jgi:hypothetical protein
VAERVEQLIAFLGSHVPQPVDQQVLDDGSVQFLGGDPPEVIVVLTDTRVTVAEFAGRWDTPFKFQLRPRRVGTVRWRRLPENALLAALSALIKGARDARRAAFQTCALCGRQTAPEWLHDEHVCQSCADIQSGAIH